jgi:hypothetical protein
MLFKKEHGASACLKIAKMRSFPLGKINPEVRSAAVQPSTLDKDGDVVTERETQPAELRASPTPNRGQSSLPLEHVGKRPAPKHRKAASRRIQSESPLSDVEMEDISKADGQDVVPLAANDKLEATAEPILGFHTVDAVAPAEPVQGVARNVEPPTDSGSVTVKIPAKVEEPLVLESVKEMSLPESETVLPAVDIPFDTAPVKKGKRKTVAKEDKRQPPKKRAKKNQPVVVEEPIDIEVDIVDAVAQLMEIDVKPVLVERPANIDPIASGLAKDDEDLYLLRLAIEAKATGKLPMLPEEAAQLQEEAAVAGEAIAELEDEEEEEGYIHPAGCARAHGYYKVLEVAKSAYLPQRNRAIVEVDQPAGNSSSNASNANNNNNAVASSRSARVATRRFVQGMEQSKKAADADSDVFAFNQLRTRKKQLKFQRSPIHDWGLYAVESITAGEMVIEYVGEVIRAQVADIREKWYEKIGIGSSYLFRVDDDAVVDATKKGSMARLINHCCTPNCTAKIITINGEKKVRVGSRAM